MSDARERKAVLELVVLMNDVQRGTAARLRNPHNFWQRLAVSAPTTYYEGRKKQGLPMGVGEWESTRDRIAEVIRLGYEAVTYIDRTINDINERGSDE